MESGIRGGRRWDSQGDGSQEKQEKNLQLCATLHRGGKHYGRGQEMGVYGAESGTGSGMFRASHPHRDMFGEWSILGAHMYTSQSAYC